MEIRELSRATHNLLHTHERFAFADYEDDEVIGGRNGDQQVSRPRIEVTLIMTSAQGFTFSGVRVGDVGYLELVTVHDTGRILPPHLREAIQAQVRGYRKSETGANVHH